MYQVLGFLDTLVITPELAFVRCYGVAVLEYLGHYLALVLTTRLHGHIGPG